MAVIPASGLVAGKSGNFLEGDEMPAVIAFERTGKLCIIKREISGVDCALR